MPKDTRQRIIDFRPPKFVVKQYKASTTDTSGSGGGVGSGDVYLPLPIITLSPGDGVLWFLRVDAGGSAPSGRGVELQTTGGGAVTFDYTALPGGWTDYIASCAGDYELSIDGVTVVKNETVYVMWDQFEGFTAGQYKLNFTHTGTVDRAILLRNVDPANPGTFYAGMSQSPTWSKTYVSNAPADITNNFPRTVSIGGSGTRRAIYAIYQMSGTVEAPAAIYSVPGVALLTYRYTDPADQPAFTRTIVSFYGDTLPTTTSVQLLAPWENGWGGVI